MAADDNITDDDVLVVEGYLGFINNPMDTDKMKLQMSVAETIVRDFQEKSAGSVKYTLRHDNEQLDIGHVTNVWIGTCGTHDVLQCSCQITDDSVIRVMQEIRDKSHTPDLPLTRFVINAFPSMSMSHDSRQLTINHICMTGVGGRRGSLLSKVSVAQGKRTFNLSRENLLSELAALLFSVRQIPSREKFLSDDAFITKTSPAFIHASKENIKNQTDTLSVNSSDHCLSSTQHTQEENFELVKTADVRRGIQGDTFADTSNTSQAVNTMTTTDNPAMQNNTPSPFIVQSGTLYQMVGSSAPVPTGNHLDELVTKAVIDRLEAIEKQKAEGSLKERLEHLESKIRETDRMSSKPQIQQTSANSFSQCAAPAASSSLYHGSYPAGSMHMDPQGCNYGQYVPPWAVHNTYGQQPPSPNMPSTSQYTLQQPSITRTNQPWWTAPAAHVTQSVVPVNTSFVPHTDAHGFQLSAPMSQPPSLTSDLSQTCVPASPYVQQQTAPVPNHQCTQSPMNAALPPSAPIPQQTPVQPPRDTTLGKRKREGSTQIADTNTDIHSQKRVATEGDLPLASDQPAVTPKSLSLGMSGDDNNDENIDDVNASLVPFKKQKNTGTENARKVLNLRGRDF